MDRRTISHRSRSLQMLLMDCSHRSHPTHAGTMSNYAPKMPTTQKWSISSLHPHASSVLHLSKLPLQCLSYWIVSRLALWQRWLRQAGAFLHFKLASVHAFHTDNRHNGFFGFRYGCGLPSLFQSVRSGFILRFDWRSVSFQKEGLKGGI